MKQTRKKHSPAFEVRVALVAGLDATGANTPGAYTSSHIKGYAG